MAECLAQSWPKAHVSTPLRSPLRGFSEPRTPVGLGGQKSNPVRVGCQPWTPEDPRAGREPKVYLCARKLRSALELTLLNINGASVLGICFRTNKRC